MAAAIFRLGDAVTCPHPLEAARHLGFPRGVAGPGLGGKIEAEPFAFLGGELVGEFFELCGGHGEKVAVGADFSSF